MPGESFVRVDRRVAGVAGVGAGRGRTSGSGWEPRAVYPLVSGWPARPTDTGRVEREASVRDPGGPLGPVERDAAIAQRGVGIVADDQVVQQGDVQQPAGRQRLRGQVEVVG